MEINLISKAQASAIGMWANLVFTLAFSGVVSFLSVSGVVMLKTKSWPLAAGSGMSGAAIAMAFLFRRSPLTKGMMVVLPAEEALREITTDLQTIQK